MSNPHDPRHDLASFTEGWVGDPRPSTRRRLLTADELLVADGPVTVPINDPVRPERVVKALLSIAGTADALLSHEAYIERVCTFYLRGGADPRPAARRNPGEW